MTPDEEARRAIGLALARAFAARGDAPPELGALLARLDSPSSPAAPARNRSKRREAR